MFATRPPGRISSVASSNVCGHADGFHRHVGAEPVGELHHPLDGVLAAVVDRGVGAEAAGALEAAVGHVDRDDPPRRVQLRGEDRGEADRPGADDRHGVAGRDHAGEHADLVGGGEDVGEEQHLLVAQPLRDLVDGVVGERHARELGLQPVDQVAEDPATAGQALAVAALLAVAAAPARAHARHEHAIAGRDGRDACADLLDGADGLVTQDRSSRGLGHVALEDVQVGAADRRGVDPHDDVGRVDDRRVSDRVPAPLTGAVVDESLHGSS